MKKSILTLLMLPLILGACTSSPSSQNNQNDSQSQSENQNSNENQNNNNNNQEENNNNQQNQNNDNSEYNQLNVGISLDEWQNYEFHNGHEPEYNESWDFYYGDSYEPNGSLWTNPNESVDYSGIEFKDKKQYLKSPEFNNYPKVEIRFEFWFSSHTSTKYKATNGEPQFLIDEYDHSGKLINTDKLEITKSNIPSNNTALEKKLYVTQNTMTQFTFKFNNFIANGDSGYTAILCKISLKGWPQV